MLPDCTIISMTLNSFLPITKLIEAIGPRLELKMRMELHSLLSKVLILEQMNRTIPNSYITRKITLKHNELFLFAFEIPPISSSYRYTIENFHLLLRNIPKNRSIVNFGDPNFPEAKWRTQYSLNGTENKVIEMFKEKMFRAIYQLSDI